MPPSEQALWFAEEVQPHEPALRAYLQARFPTLGDHDDRSPGVESAALLAELGDLLRAEDDKGQDKLNDLYRRIISLPDRARTMKSLADSLRVMIDLQRQALGMDAKGSASDGGGGTSRISVEFVRPQKRYDEDE